MTEQLRLEIVEEFPAGEFAVCDDCMKAVPKGVRMFKAIPRWSPLHMNICQSCADLNNRNLTPPAEEASATSKAATVRDKKKTRARKRRNVLPEEE